MRLTLYTDYSIRVLMHLGSVPKGELVTLRDISTTYDISINHLMKIVQSLRKEEYIRTVRGRNGGIILAKEPAQIYIGTLVRILEDLNVVDSSEDHHALSTLTFSFIFEHAVDHFLSALNQYTLEDLINYTAIEASNDVEKNSDISFKL
ncbi:RrF2 family transcriptional regulator [Alkalicoccobacillus plakortidis]|uniref:HTH-type transcriptional regulator NsrR n=1 Tax=Alkalicoccobacillus plakortidis TaxID=444060 RepID=A0ABT0XNV3_9BACI|nr:Rrf2 family transcriptional regulator [Alkalicoccobacillus plakortidis]MCM2677583.1 Rrf2 family transcriptional regulator [Alkalicoccobacillus plakortidis]